MTILTFKPDYDRDVIGSNAAAHPHAAVVFQTDRLHEFRAAVDVPRRVSPPRPVGHDVLGAHGQYGGMKHVILLL